MIVIPLYLWIISGFLFLLGLLGTLIPIVPPIIPLWAAFIIFEFFGGPGVLPLFFWLGILFLSLLILAADYFANAYFVKRHGGSRLAMLGAAVGLIIGMIFLGPIGVLIGPFVLTIIISLFEHKNGSEALKIGLGTVSAFFSSFFVKIFLQLVMIIWFIFLVI